MRISCFWLVAITSILKSDKFWSWNKAKCWSKQKSYWQSRLWPLKFGASTFIPFFCWLKMQTSAFNVGCSCFKVTNKWIMAFQMDQSTNKSLFGFGNFLKHKLLSTLPNCWSFICYCWMIEKCRKMLLTFS